MPLVIVFVGSLLGLAVAGLPSRREDAPLSVQTASTVATSTTTITPRTTAAPPPTTAGRRPAELKVTAFNSSSVPGAATKMGARLKSLGYVVQPPGPDRKPQDQSVVMYRSGLEPDARALASSLGLDAGVVKPIEPPVAAVGDTDLAVLVGTELARRPT